MWFDQVVELEAHIMRMYLTMPWTVELGLVMILWRRPRVRAWSTPSIGSSPSRKCKAGIGDDLLSFKNPLMTLFWNISRDFMLVGRIGSAGRPESSLGRLQVLHRWI